MTIGHLNILQRALPLFDRIIVAIGVNSDKKGFMPIEERLARIRHATREMPNVEVTTYDTLTTAFCKKKQARYIIRGVRSQTDFEYERNIAAINRLLDPEIETVLLFADARFEAISSSMVRELAAFGEDISPYVV